MLPFKIRFKNSGFRTIKLTLDQHSRDTISSRLYKLSQKKMYETEIVSFLDSENQLLEGILMPTLDSVVRWSHIRTHNHKILSMDAEKGGNILTLRYEFDATSADYLCLSILEQDHYVCILKEGKGDKDIRFIRTTPELIAQYSSKNK
ncbi:MAG: hypothetical protein INR69_09825 [Mucilaginibacter polytrichastri]|nr:hypothetical protein [Mucilaginibacter polytrichastri]